MLREVCKAKIHRLTVTEANLDYEGSITIDQDLLDAAGILPYEKVQVANVSNGNRLNTYTISGTRKSGQVCINGAAAHLAKEGDIVLVISYATLNDDEFKTFKPKIVFVDEKNRIKTKSKVISS
ncbi:aspartate 1-decarboxylase [Candidatus Margulisiibacteriota bacterium]